MTFWERVCDEMVRISHDDPELEQSIHYINEYCKITKESFYDRMFKIIYRDKTFKN
jgi:hypothetical protein